MRSLIRVILASIFLIIPIASAAPNNVSPAVDVPAPLEPWVNWVKDRHPEYRCALLDQNRVCDWPGRLNLDVGKSGGEFNLSVRMDQAGFVPLPGGHSVPPLDISRNDKEPVKIAVQTDGYQIWLPPGDHEIRGAFHWSEMPRALPIPPSVGLIRLRANGSETSVKLNEDNEIWLSPEKSFGETAGDSLAIEVFRRLREAHPFSVDTRLRLRVSGKVRDVNFGEILPAGVRPLSIQSELPFQFNSGNVKGRAGKGLTVQLRPGEHELTILGTMSAPPKSLAPVPSSVPEWPEAEVWSWLPDESLRSVEASGGIPVDGARMEVPPDFRGQASWQLKSSEHFDLKELRRGDPGQPNILNLQRDFWLALTGGGLSVRDSFSGSMKSQFRLNTAPGLTLGRVQNNGQDILITSDVASGQSGVELRTEALNVQAEGRTDGLRIKAVGWDTDVQSLDSTLRLPPGWTLFHASGPDAVSDSWVSSWALIDIFMVILVLASAYRVLSLKVAALAGATMILLHNIPDAPQMVWIMLLLTLFLVRNFPNGTAGRLWRLLRMITGLSAALILVDFTVSELRRGFYPQLEMAAYPSYPQTMGASAPVRMYEEGKVAYDSIAESAVSGGRLLPKNKVANKQFQILDPDAVIQTGAGLPNWNWRQYSLRWLGPVTKDSELKLCLIGPRVNFVLSILRVLLSLGFAYLLLKDWVVRFPWRKASPVILMLCLFGRAEAQSFPTDSMLKELEARVFKDECTVNCVAFAEASVAINWPEFRLSGIVTARAESGLPLPGNPDDLRLGSLLLDGQETKALRRSDDGTLWVRVPSGQHRVELTGTLAKKDSLTVNFPLAPLHISGTATNAVLSGISEQGQLLNALQISRSSTQASTLEEQAKLPNWYRVTRHLTLATTWEVNTEVTRMGDLESPASLNVALIPGQTVTDSDSKAEGNKVLVSFLPGESSSNFAGTLPPQSELSLVAPENPNYSESWRVVCTNLFACSKSSGINPIDWLVDGAQEFVWEPFPGDEVKLSIAKTKGLPGDTVTVDEVAFNSSPGQRLMSGDLSLSVRSSSGGQYSLSLPAGAKVIKLTRDGRPLPYASDNNKVTFALAQGGNRFALSFEMEREGFSFITKVPQISLGTPSNNLTITLAVPENRWLLFVFGPYWGPAVLFWAKLIGVIIFAAMLARTALTPLTFISWLFLGLGVATLEPSVILIPVIWLVAHGLRRKSDIASVFWFNLRQIGLVFLTFVALSILFVAVRQGLILNPDMGVAGNMSNQSLLRWYVDRSGGPLPVPGMVSLPLWVWRVFMLAWAIWLVFALLAWLRWCFDCWSEGGRWKKRVKAVVVSPPIQ